MLGESWLPHDFRTCPGMPCGLYAFLDLLNTLLTSCSAMVSMQGLRSRITIHAVLGGYRWLGLASK